MGAIANKKSISHGRRVAGVRPKENRIPVMGGITMGDAGPAGFPKHRSEINDYSIAVTSTDLDIVRNLRQGYTRRFRMGETIASSRAVFSDDCLRTAGRLL